MVSKQQDMDKVVRQAVHGLLSTSNAFEMVQLRYGGEEPRAPQSVAEAVVTTAPPSSLGKAVVEDWECLRVRGGWCVCAHQQHCCASGHGWRLGGQLRRA